MKTFFGKKDNAGNQFFLLYLQCILPNKPWFLHVCSVRLLKILWKMEKLLIMSNLSFIHSVLSFFFWDLSAIFIKLKIVVCKAFKFGRLVIWVRIEKIYCILTKTYLPSFFSTLSKREIIILTTFDLMSAKLMLSISSTSAEACEKSSRCLWKKSCESFVSTGVRKPGKTCVKVVLNLQYNNYNWFHPVQNRKDA